MNRFFRTLLGGQSWLTRWFKRTVFLGFLLVAILVVARAVAIGKANGLLEVEIAAVEKTDKRWHIDEIMADRPPVADEENSVNVMMKARALLPPKWALIDPPKPEGQPVGEGVEDEGAEVRVVDLEAGAEEAPMPRIVLHPADPADPLDNDVRNRFGKIEWNQPLDDRLLRDIETVRERYLPALTELQKLPKFERGRHPVKLTPLVIDTLLPTIQETRELAAVLQVEAAFNVRKGRSSAAVENIRAMLSICRSYEHEPFLIAYLVRVAIGSVAVSATERLLALGNPTAEDLLSLEKLLAREEADLSPHLFRSIRSERGGSFQTVEALRTGAANPAGLGVGGNGQDIAIAIGNVALGPIIYPRSQASLLRLMTEMMQAQGKPFREQVDHFDAIEKRMKQAKIDAIIPDLAMLLLPAVQKVAHACHRSTAQIRCCRGALFVEAFRLRNNRMPASLEEACSSLKVPVPTDPWDDKPLKFKRDEGGVSVYSVGADGIDDGGKRHEFNRDEKGFDIVFRLGAKK